MNHLKKAISAGCDYCSRGLTIFVITLAIVKFKKSYMIIGINFSYDDLSLSARIWQTTLSNLEKRKQKSFYSWKMDETYIKIKGKMALFVIEPSMQMV